VIPLKAWRALLNCKSEEVLRWCCEESVEFFQKEHKSHGWSHWSGDLGKPVPLCDWWCVYSYVARTQQHWNEHDTWTLGKFLKIHMTRASDARVRQVSDMTRLHDRSVRATNMHRVLVHTHWSITKHKLSHSGTKGRMLSGLRLQDVVLVT